MRVSLNNLPAANRTFVQAFSNLTGGLNLRDLHIQLSDKESPRMENLWWEDGVLQSRNGQTYRSDDTSLGTGYACYGELFWCHAFFHIGEKLYCMDMDNAALTELISGVPESAGTFFRYLDWLFYKNRGGYYRIRHNTELGGDPFIAEDMLDGANFDEPSLRKIHVPVIQINTDPETGAGDLYQPENRLSAKKIIRYNATATRTAYRIPIYELDSVDEVYIDGVLLTEGEDADYTVNLALGMVYFKVAPPVTDPPTNNTVEIHFSKKNHKAYDTVMGCDKAFVSGGDQGLCVLLTGCEEQPNAVFWNDRDELSMNPGYFPIEYYNLVGDTEDEVTGFGKQYSDTIVLKKRSIGRLDFSTQDLNGRESISFTYTNINARVGCDLPGSIQLIENNLVFCNTSQGVHIIRSSSAAYENNVECISGKINGSTMPGLEEHHIRGLLHDLRTGGVVTSFDDDQRYWLCANGHVWMWDYSLSTHSDPSWFYLTGISPVALFRGSDHKLHHLDSLGRVTAFERTFSDYGEGFMKLYQFPVMNFGSYERKKDITSLLLAVRSDTESKVFIRYDTDYDSRDDLTEVNTWQWVWRNMDMNQTILGYYNAEAARYAKVVRRNPGCRNIRHFTFTLSNDAPGQDLAVVSAQVLYKFRGKER